MNRLTIAWQQQLKCGRSWHRSTDICRLSTTFAAISCNICCNLMQHLLQSTQNGSSLATQTNTTKPTHLYQVHCHSLGMIQISLELSLQLPSPQTIKSHGAYCLPLLNFPCLTSGPLSFLSALNSPFSCCSIFFFSLPFSIFSLL